ncbi:unnamed protein product [Phyllotreta striolata]|uniref:protein-histidine N-methyltransferase n=1 Tax=Phyllotreta striolata TaxID=444603 RepID=A0A9N9TS42_PHYSR|nr:unnamed protein product [Phyllotreta striolata]
MGRKGQGHKSKKTNSNRSKRELDELVDKLLRLSTTQQNDCTKSLEDVKEIRFITEQLLNLQQSNTNATTIRSGVVVEEFVKWCGENQAKLEGCQIAEFEGFDLGLKVCEEIPPASLVISVPRNLFLTVEAAKKTELKRLFDKDQMLRNMHNVALAMFLIFERFKSDSFWRPYINMLPSSYTTVLYFTVDELLELKGSPTFETALKQIKSIARQYAYFHKLFHTSDDPVCVFMREKFTYDVYRWAVSTVMTRQNTIPSEDGETTMNALIPLWDICNHTNGQITTDYNPEKKRCECLALKQYQPGEQFFIFYGARTNADLFIHNGFVYEDNIYDGYWMKLGISKSDPLQEKRTELLNKLQINPTGSFFLKKAPLHMDGALLAFVRIFNMNEEQLRHWLDSDRSDDVQYLECALDTCLEKKSWSFLQARLKLLLAIYKTTLEEDGKLLEDTGLGTNRKLAIRMRSTEKSILRSWMDYVDQYIKQ